MRVGQIAVMLLVSVSYVSKVLSRRRLTGERTARPQRGHLPARLTGHHAAIREQVRQRADATIGELRAWLRDAHKIAVSTGLMWQTLAALGLTLKKRSCTPRSRTVPMSLRRVRHGARLNPS
jgi:transposase